MTTLRNAALLCNLCAPAESAALLRAKEVSPPLASRVFFSALSPHVSKLPTLLHSRVSYLCPHPRLSTYFAFELPCCIDCFLQACSCLVTNGQFALPCCCLA